MRFIAVFLLAITLLSVSVNGQGTTSSCSFNGIDYGNLANASSYSALSLASGSNAAGKYRFYWNICSPSAKACNSQVMAACQLTVGTTGAPTNVGAIALGSFAAAKAPASGTVLTYTTNSGGCSNGAIMRSMDITLTCGTGPIVISGVAEESKCQYGVTMTGASLCGSGGSTDSQGNPSKPGIGGGWIFIIVLLSVTVVYIVGGVIFNAKVKHLHGTEMFPNKDLWVSFGGLIKDGVFFIKSKVTGGGGSGYQQV